MKTLITSRYATNGSSNFGPNWQRDHNYFVPAATKPAIYQAFVDRFNVMWSDTQQFVPLRTDAAVCAEPRQPGAERQQRAREHDAHLEHGGVGGQLRRVSRYVTVKPQSGRQRPGADGR